jgi:hypothetical protein
MNVLAARILMAIATRWLSDHRSEWACAMQAEFDEAADAGAPLTFALGCLVGAWRDATSHEEGRFGLASYVLALGIVLPVTALLVASLTSGRAYLSLAQVGYDVALGSGKPSFPINYANRAGLPLMAVLTSILAIGHVYVAWAILEREWDRVARASLAGAALTLTVLLCTVILFLEDLCALPQAFAVATELVIVWCLVQWRTALTDATQA